MKFAILIIGGSLFLLTLSVSAGTFLETFDNFNLQDWEEVTERNLPVGKWRVVNGNVGSVGFGLAGYTARFDNLKITGEDVPNHGNLSVQPQGKLAVTWGQLKSKAF